MDNIHKRTELKLLNKVFTSISYLDYYGAYVVLTI